MAPVEVIQRVTRDVVPARKTDIGTAAPPLTEEMKRQTLDGNDPNFASPVFGVCCAVSSAGSFVVVMAIAHAIVFM